MDRLLLTEIIFAALYLINAVCVLTIIFVERKEPAATITWLLIMTYLPGIGVIFYLFFGRGFKVGIHKRLRVKRDLETKYKTLNYKERKHLENFLDTDVNRIKKDNPEMEKYMDLITMHFNMGVSHYSQDNAVEIFIDAKEKYQNLFEDIAKAEKNINLLYFIIKNDSTGKKLISLLAEKAAQGVEVRLLYDDLGSITTPITLFTPLKRAGGHVRKFFPFKLGSILRANYRNHRKIVVIDGVIGYLGGMNIGDEYMGLHKKKTPWRDTHMRITGSAVLSLQMRFYMDWFYATENHQELIEDLSVKNFPETRGTGKTGIQIVSSGPDAPGEEIKLGIIKMIHMAKKTIFIQSPYLMPDAPVLEALYIAAASGVDVLVMLPGIPDKKLVYYVTYSYIENLLNHGIKVYLHKGFLHAKMVVIDDELATIGTTNLDMRSFGLHFEVNAFIYDVAEGQKCADIFRKDLLDCKKLTLESYKSRGLLNRFAESILRLFAPLM